MYFDDKQGTRGRLEFSASVFSQRLVLSASFCSLSVLTSERLSRLLLLTQFLLLIFVLVPNKTAGWEHIYDYLGHILGAHTKYSGIGMHLGHYHGHLNFMISLGQAPMVQGFFNAKYWVRFITAGAALWLQSPTYGG
jgi:hypothetical protein